MRMVSYNMLDGGEGRATALADVIESQSPDVVALVEADNSAVLEQIANRLQMDFIFAPGNSHASALMSRWTIRDPVNHAVLRPEVSKSLLEATVIEPGGREWASGVVLHHRASEADERVWWTGSVRIKKRDACCTALAPPSRMIDSNVRICLPPSL
jgi:hypothetical protein